VNAEHGRIVVRRKRARGARGSRTVLGRSVFGLTLVVSVWSCGGGSGPSRDGSPGDAKSDAHLKRDAIEQPDRAKKLDAPERKDTAAAEDGRLDRSSGDGSRDRVSTIDAAADAGTDGARADAARDAGVDAPPFVCETDAGAPPDGAAPEGSRIAIELDPLDAEWVTDLQWLDSTSTLTDNLAAFGGPLTCNNDPQEFFGQSYGVPEQTTPYPVIAGHLASSSWCGSHVTITGAALDCGGTAAIPVTTTYQFYSGTRANEVQVSRSFGFDATTPVFTGTGLRPYVPRVPYEELGNVIYPNMAGTATTVMSTYSCSADCLIDPGTDWSGEWFADVDLTSGLALIVLRDPAMTSPVELTLNTDGFSDSNLSSFVLVQPTLGWLQPITEVEYLCFADLTTWPQADRDAAMLPAGCGP
jgi:hypothetical protein